MPELRIHPSIQKLKEFKKLQNTFGIGYLRQIDKFLRIPFKDSVILSNSFYPDKVVLVSQKDYLHIIDFFNNPLPLYVFLDKLQKQYKINLSKPGKKDLDKVQELFNFLILLIQNNFIVYEIFDEYKRLTRLRLQAISNRFPTAAYIMTSLDCNFRCPGCFIYAGDWDRAKKCTTLTPQVFDKQFKYIMRLIPKDKDLEFAFIFYGGEPLLNKPMIEYASKKIRRLEKRGAFGKIKLSLTLVTNGSLIDDEAVKLIKKYRIMPGVSFDGVGKTNDAQRIFQDGKGTFDSIMKGIRLLEKNAIPFGLSWTIGPENINSVISDLGWVSKNLENPNIFFNVLKGVQGKGKPFGKMSDKTLIKKLTRIYDKMNELDLLDGRLERYARPAKRGYSPYQFYCSAMGGGQFVLRPDGKIGICHAGLMRDEKQFQSPREMGDTLKDPVWLEWFARTPVFIKECYLNCAHFSLCPGGCAYRDGEITGDLYTVANETCLIEKFLVERGVIESCFPPKRKTKKRS